MAIAVSNSGFDGNENILLDGTGNKLNLRVCGSWTSYVGERDHGVDRADMVPGCKRWLLGFLCDISIFRMIFESTLTWNNELTEIIHISSFL